ncbi:site-specific integrase [Streptomyces poriticola]|uniref:site-specific integrase n=1 Tax=Streptomyces poriticola TaxID=3120506 RepID=UPI002FCE0A99
MRVPRMLTPGSTTESWTLLGDDLRPVDPVESFLSYLAAIERSPNTVKAYAHDLKDWWYYLDGRALERTTVDLEAVGLLRGLASASTAGPERGGGGLDPLRHCYPDPAQRLLRAARSEDLPARQRLPDLPGLPSLGPSSAGAHRHRDHLRPSPAKRASPGPGSPTSRT